MKCLSNSNSKAASCTVKSNLKVIGAGQKIAILGGGLTGRLLAWRLSNQNIDNGIMNNHQISVFEKGSLNPCPQGPNNQSKAAAYTAAAMLSPMSELVASEPEIFTLGQQSLLLWPSWLNELGCEEYFHQQGSLVLAHPNDLTELQQFQRDLSYKLDQLESDHNNTASKRIKALSNRQQLEQAETHIASHFHQGLLLPDEAHLDHHEILAELLTVAKQHGVSFIESQPVELDDPRLDEFDLIFDCRGIGSKGSDKNLRGVRGEVVWLESQEITLKRPIRLMHPRYKLYVVPKPNHRFIIGATEIESEDTSAISLRSSMELMSALYAINPAFSEARIIAQESNLRPAFIDNLPQIKQTLSKFGKPIISINGLYRHGFLIGPAMVEQAINKAFS